MKKSLVAAAFFSVVALGASAQSFSVILSSTSGQLTSCNSSSAVAQGLPATSWNVGGTDPFTYGTQGGGAGKTSLNKLVINRTLEGCGSPQLQKLFLSQKPFNNLTLTEYKNTPGRLEPLMVLTLSNVFLDSYQIGGSFGSPAQESLGIDYEKLCVTNYSYSPTGQSSSTEACFDQVKQIASPNFLVKGSAAFIQR